MSNTNDAVARLRADLNDVHNLHWSRHHDDIKTVLDRLDAAEKVVELSYSLRRLLKMHVVLVEDEDKDDLDEYLDALLEYEKTCRVAKGGRDEA